MDENVNYCIFASLLSQDAEQKYQMDRFSFLNAAHTAHFAELYDQYLLNPDSVEASWRAFFQGFDFGMENAEPVSDDSGTTPAAIPEAIQKEFQIVKLIDAYRNRGHLFTKTNPVRERRKYAPTLEIENFGLSQADMTLQFEAGSILGLGRTSLREIVNHLEAIYCDHIGIEYMYIRNPEEIAWIQNWLNKNDNHPEFSAEEKKHILKKLNQTASFEGFLHSKYVGQKRFSVEGLDAMIPGLDTLIERGSDNGIEQFVVGMAHRGRLNVLANIFGKSPEAIFSEFDGKEYAEDELFDGDVKYHLGLYDGLFYDTYGDTKAKQLKDYLPTFMKNKGVATWWNSYNEKNNQLGIKADSYSIIDVNPKNNNYFKFNKYYLPKKEFK